MTHTDKNRIRLLKSHGINPYPSRSHRTGLIATLTGDQQDGGNPQVIAGRIKELVESSTGELQVRLEDESGGILFVIPGNIPTETGTLRKSDLVEVTGNLKSDQFQVLKVRLLAPSSVSDPPAPLVSHQKLRGNLEIRAQICHSIRKFFRNKGFIEIEAPYLYPSPALDPW